MKYSNLNGTDLSCAIDNKLVKEIQSYEYIEDNDKKDAVGTLNIEFILFTNTFVLLEPILENEGISRSFTARYIDEFDNKVFYDFTNIYYAGLKTKTDIDDATVSVVLKFDVIDKPHTTTILSKDFGADAFEEGNLKNYHYINCKDTYIVNVYTPEIIEPDRDISEYISNLYKTCIYEDLDLEKIYSDIKFFVGCPCIIKRNDKIYYLGSVEGLENEAKKYKNDKEGND